MKVGPQCMHNLGEDYEWSTCVHSIRHLSQGADLWELLKFKLEHHATTLDSLKVIKGKLE